MADGYRHADPKWGRSLSCPKNGRVSGAIATCSQRGAGIGSAPPRTTGISASSFGNPREQATDRHLYSMSRHLSQLTGVEDTDLRGTIKPTLLSSHPHRVSRAIS